MRRYFVLVLVLLLALSGCGSQSGEIDAASGEEGVCFVDDLGRTVAVKEPQRVAVLTGSFADIWCLAGGRDCLVAAPHDAWTSFELGLDQQVTDLGGIKTPDLELLLAAQPDLVLISGNTASQVELLDVMEAAGLNAACFKVTVFEEYLRMLDVCTQITGQRERYEQYGLALEEQIEAAKARADGSAPRVLYVRAAGSGCKVKNSHGSVLGEMLADLGCVNIADSDSGLLESLSMEAILAADPEHIFVVLQGADSSAAKASLEKTLLSNPAWQSLSAVREGRFHTMEHQLYNLRPNARWGEAYEKLADILYPEK